MAYLIITNTVADIYNGPGFTNSVVSQAILGESCRMLKEDQNWIQVEMEDGYRGWVHQFHGIVKDTPYRYNHVVRDLFACISEKDRNMVKHIVFGSQLFVESSRKMVKVLLPDGTTGIMKGSDDKLYSGSATRGRILECAKMFLGIPYRWGGRTSYGFDCSGLVQTIFKAFDIKLPRDAWQQADYLGDRAMATKRLEKGDLLFFSEDEKVTHVGISMGGKQFIHAHGEVRINSIDPADRNYNKKLSVMKVVGKSINSLLK